MKTTSIRDKKKKWNFVRCPGPKHIWQSSFNSKTPLAPHRWQVLEKQSMNHFGWFGCLNNLCGLYSQNEVVKSDGRPSPKNIIDVDLMNITGIIKSKNSLYKQYHLKRFELTIDWGCGSLCNQRYRSWSKCWKIKKDDIILTIITMPVNF